MHLPHRYGKLSCDMGRDHSVTCHTAEMKIPPGRLHLQLQPKQLLDLATPEGCKSELTYAT